MKPAHKSTSWLTKVEGGERTVDNVSVLSSLANVLKVGLGDLIGGVELPPNGGEPLQLPRGIHAISRAIMTSSHWIAASDSLVGTRVR
jgi:hypothetical protein